MAKARVAGLYPDDPNVPGGLGDDGTNGWFGLYSIAIVGAGAPGGFDMDIVEVHFGDQDSAATVKEKIANAIKQRFTDRAIPFSLPIVNAVTGDRYVPSI